MEKKLTNSGPLREPADKHSIYPLSLLERSVAQQFVAVEQALMLQNMYLALQAMGLGGWMFGTGSPLIVLGGTSLPGLAFALSSLQQRAKTGSSIPWGWMAWGAFGDSYVP